MIVVFASFSVRHIVTFAFSLFNRGAPIQLTLTGTDHMPGSSSCVSPEITSQAERTSRTKASNHREQIATFVFTDIPPSVNEFGPERKDG